MAGFDTMCELHREDRPRASIADAQGHCQQTSRERVFIFSMGRSEEKDSIRTRTLWFSRVFES